MFSSVVSRLDRETIEETRREMQIIETTDLSPSLRSGRDDKLRSERMTQNTSRTTVHSWSNA